MADQGTDQTTSTASERIEPILAHLKVDNLDVDKIRTHFNQLWEFDHGDSLSKEEQHLTTIAIFIYATHAALDDINFNVVKARGVIAQAFQDWLAPETDKQMSAEKASDNPFHTFVETQSPTYEDKFEWRHFMMENKKTSDKEWIFKMKQCWFAAYFIRMGRVDWIETACCYDKVPFVAREDYVNLKLSNTFAKLGKFCQFKATPKS